MFEDYFSKLDKKSSHDNKIDYKSLETAEKSAQAMATKKKCGFDAYKCRHCEGYHIGKSPILTSAGSGETIFIQIKIDKNETVHLPNLGIFY